MKYSTKLLASVGLGALMALPAAIPVNAAVNEIVVTTRKRTELMRDVPISVTAFTAEAIRDKGITDINDVALFTPGLNFESAFGRGNDGDRTIIRGMSNIFGSGASMFVDGVYQNTTIKAADLTNLERIEVIRGPQSALYGRGTFSGAVNFITKKPGDEFEGNLTGTYATWDQQEISGRVSGPLIKDTLFFALNGRYYYFGGDYENKHPSGGQLNKQESVSLGGQLRWTPASTFEANLKFDYSEDDDGPFAQGTQFSDQNNCFLSTLREYFCGEISQLPASDIGTNKALPRAIGGNNGGIQRWTYRGVLDLNWEFAEGWNIESKSSYDIIRTNSFFDATGTSTDVITGFELFAPVAPDKVGFIFRPGIFDKIGFGWLAFSGEERRAFSQDLRIISPQDARLRWSIGGYYLDRESDTLDLDMGGAVVFNRPLNNKAVYGYIEYDVTEDLEVTFEGRWAQDTIKQIDIPSGERQKAKFSSFTPRFTAKWDVNDDMNVYGTIAKGTRPGGFNTTAGFPSLLVASNPELATFDEETVWSFEVGSKSSWFDNTVTTNIAFYYLDWGKQQLTSAFQFALPGPDGVFGTVDDDVDFGSAIINAGKTRVLGAEFDIRWAPNDNWNFQATYAYNNAEFTKFLSDDQEDLTGDPSVKGNKTPRSPMHMATFSAGYTQPLSGEWEGFVRGDVAYESKKYVQIHNLANYGEGARVNVRAGIKKENLRIELWGKNVFDYGKPAAVTRFIDLKNGALFSVVDRAGLGLPDFQPVRAFQITPPRKAQWGITASLSF